MLVLARKVGQTVLIGEEIEITVSSVRGDQVRLAIKAPRCVSIFRKEAVEQVEIGNAAAIDAAEGLFDLLNLLPTAEAPPPDGTPEPTPPKREIR